MKTTKRGCTHSEGICHSDVHATECKVRDNDQHDCAYVDARNKLIPVAERAAHQYLSDHQIPHTPGAYAHQFTVSMETLVRERGVVR